MRVPLGIFIQFSTLLFLGLSWSFQKFEVFFAEKSGDKEQIQILKNQLELKEFETKISSLENEKMNQQVLSLLDQDSRLTNNSLLKNHIKQGLRTPASVRKLDFSLLRIEELRSLFREKKYSKVIELGERILGQEKTFIVKPEVLFFLSESYFLNKQYEKSVEKINQLINLYPEHIMTGYSLLRLGSISEKSEQVNEAESIYKIIIAQFHDSALTGEAKRLLSNLNE